MVRRIDGEARRRDLAEAVWRVVLREGLPAASVRTVAAEAGLSAGSVRHFFTTQRELIEFSMRELVATVGGRIERAAAIEDPEERLVTMLSQLVPVTEASRAEAFAHLQFVSAARFDPALETIARESFHAIRDFCGQVVTWLAQERRLRPDVDPDAVATSLAALVDGLTVELLFAPDMLSPDEARAVLRNHLRAATTEEVSS